jgi:hypothetical protein
LSVAAWLIYALLMNVRHAVLFRGSRAAWLSILGLALLVATFGLITALPADTAATAADPQTMPTQPLDPVVTGEGG